MNLTFTSPTGKAIPLSTTFTPAPKPETRDGNSHHFKVNLKIGADGKELSFDFWAGQPLPDPLEICAALSMLTNDAIDGAKTEKEWENVYGDQGDYKAAKEVYAGFKALPLSLPDIVALNKKATASYCVLMNTPAPAPTPAPKEEKPKAKKEETKSPAPAAPKAKSKKEELNAVAPEIVEKVKTGKLPITALIPTKKTDVSDALTKNEAVKETLRKKGLLKPLTSGKTPTPETLKKAAVIARPTMTGKAVKKIK
jgi:hypothetical protein